MNRHRVLLAALIAVGSAAHAQAAAMLLYQQVYNPPAAGQSGAILPWSINMVGGYAGTYDGAFDAGGLRDAATNGPIGRTGPADTAGTAVYTGNGSANPIVNDLRAFYTVDGAGGFTTIDPATCPDNLYFNIWANTQGGGADDHGYFIVQAGPGGRDPSKWYIAAQPMATPTQNQGALFDLRSLLYNPAAGNWNNLTIDPTNTVAPTIGGPAGSLAGLLITGVGVLQAVNNPANDYSSWNYSDYRITCGAIPEPTALVLLAIAAPGLLVCRRQQGNRKC